MNAATQLNESLLQGNLDRLPKTRVPVASLMDAESPRCLGEDPEHVRAIAELEEDLPPIVVNRASRRVIDGMHRLKAARLRGDDEVEVRLFDGDDASSFVLAVRVNIIHGLPLTLTDRKAAAERIVKAYPQWSDRMVALVTGLAAKTVAALRGRPSGEIHHLDGRVGRDGRVRPLDAAEGRERAAKFIAANPSKSLREIARASGVSPETARSVRHRMHNGEDPVSRRKCTAKGGGTRLPARSEPEGKLERDGGLAVRALTADPAFRSSESGRVLLRMLAMYQMLERHRHEFIERIPGHCLPRAAAAAYHCARVWHDFGECIERRSELIAGASALASNS